MSPSDVTPTRTVDTSDGNQRLSPQTSPGRAASDSLLQPACSGKVTGGAQSGQKQGGIMNGNVCVCVCGKRREQKGKEGMGITT